MRNLLIACETLRDEIENVKGTAHFDGDIVWMNTSLHNDPDLLRSELQKVIDNSIGFDHILLSYGSCGNATVGLKATRSKLVIPVTSDCISMLLCKHTNVNVIRKDTYFLTKGWINGEKSIIVEYQHCLDKYGVKRAQRIFSAMFKHYKNLMLIDTKSYTLNKYETISREMAEKVNLNFTIESGSLTILEKLLSEDWDEDFALVNLGEEILLEHFDNQVAG